MLTRCKKTCKCRGGLITARRPPVQIELTGSYETVFASSGSLLSTVLKLVYLSCGTIVLRFILSVHSKIQSVFPRSIVSKLNTLDSMRAYSRFTLGLKTALLYLIVVLKGFRDRVPCGCPLPGRVISSYVVFVAFRLELTNFTMFLETS